MRQVAGGCKQFASSAFVGDNGGMKRGNDKKIPRATPARHSLLKRATPVRENTGGPPASALQALQVGNWLEYTIEQNRQKRQLLAQDSTDKIAGRVWLDLWELADRVLNPMRLPRFTRKGLENAAEQLSAMAVTAADLLEELADDSNPKYEIILAAARNHKWPVNLSLGRKGKTVSLQGADDAKKYLIKIKVGWGPRGPLHSLTNPKATIFTRAAELILHQLLDWRERDAWKLPSGEPDAWEKRTSWNKDLLSLRYPMTARNVADWWALAKLWLDEQWEANPKLFKPLIASCKSKGKSLAGDRHEHFPSEVRRDVIDVRLREAFFALAK
jgi:hypothetical protein